MNEKPLHIAVDARCLNRPYIRGMGRYLREVVVRGERSGHRATWDLIADRPELPFGLPELGNARRDMVTCRGYRFHWWDQRVLPRSAARGKADVLFCPATALPWWQPAPTVVTVHDTLCWAPEDPDLGPYTKWIIPAAYRKCAAMITISESSRKDILAKWPHFAPKLHVIHHGVDDSFLDAAPGPLTDNLKALGVASPYLLYHGGELLRKRAEWAVDVLAGLQDPTMKLVMCGLGKKAQERVTAAMKPELRARVIYAPFIDEADMIRLYQNAVALLYPTLYEGFGFPALEAQALGTPALFSAVGSLAELQGPGARVLPTDDLNAWVGVVKKLSVERRDLRPDQKARDWARGFSWDVSAAKHMEIFRSVAGRRVNQTDAAETHRAPSRESLAAVTR